MTTSAERPSAPTPVTATPEQTVLVVEDSDAERTRISVILTKFGYRVLTATDGAAAVAVLREQTVDIVLSDWKMPELSGIDLCRMVRADPSLGRPYFVLVTGNSSDDDRAIGMKAGADDFITKPFHAGELRTRLLASKDRDESPATPVAARAEAPHDNTAQHPVDEPAPRPIVRSPFPELEAANLLQLAGALAGDCFDLFELDDQHLGFFHATVPGHDATAALQCKRIHRQLAPDQLSATVRRDAPADRRLVAPEDVVAGLSRCFLTSSDSCREFTLVYGVINVTTGAGRLCQAGHPDPLLVTADGQVRRFPSAGFPIGKHAEAMYQGQDFTLYAGDRLFVYSPGIEACRDTQGRPFGIQLLATLLVNSNRNPLGTAINLIDELIRSWHAGAQLQEDISALALTRPARD